MGADPPCGFIRQVHFPLGVKKVARLIPRDPGRSLSRSVEARLRTPRPKSNDLTVSSLVAKTRPPNAYRNRSFLPQAAEFAALDSP
jgi:hypothetical protein